jgi:4-amino-4-deoxy-L-arabinose transferase-like glycosyltransferase
VAEREWREASDMRVSTLGIGSVLLCAAILRFWALGYGIPFALGIDEPETMDRVVRIMKTGDFNPHFFDYPSLYIYVQVAVACTRFLLGAMSGAWRSLSEVGAADFYLWGRAVTAILGTLTVLLVYRIGMRWGTRHAVLAAALLALMPHHVRESHYVLTDVPMTFLTTLTLLLALRAHEKGTLGAFAAAGASAGLATATKYPGMVALLLPIMAAYMTRGGDRPRLRPALAASGTFLAVFLLAAPYTVLDLPSFLNGFGHLAGSVPLGQTSHGPGWLLYLKHLRTAIGWPGLVLMFGGLGLFLVRVVTGPGQTRFALVLAFTGAYFALIATRQLVFARYLLPVVPLVCLLIAVAVVSGVSLLRRFDIPRWARTALIAALTVAAMLPPAIGAVKFDRMASRKWTYAIAFEWISANLPAGSRVALDGHALRLPDARFRVEYFRRLIDRSYEDLAKDGFDYFVATSQSYGPVFEKPQEYPEDYARYRKLFDQGAPLLTIDSSADHPGPQLRIFQIRR